MTPVIPRQIPMHDTTHFMGIQYKGALIHLLLACLLSLLVTGCGTASSQEHLLRINRMDSFMAPARISTPESPVYRIRLYETGTLPGLNRAAVLIARGNVLTPSSKWYWEGVPATLFTQALERQAADNPQYEISSSPRSRSELHGVLRMSIRAFEVVAESPYKVRGAVQMELWTPDERRRLGMAGLTAEKEIAHMEAGYIIEAASEVLQSIANQSMAWLEDMYSQPEPPSE